MVSRLTGLTSLLILGAAMACRSASPPLWIAPGNPPECTAAVERARAAPDSQPAPGREAARIIELHLPPQPAPAAVRGRALRVRVLVDEQGRPDPGGVTVEGSPDSAYARDLRALVLRHRFRPAREAGCWVPGLVIHQLTVARARGPTSLGAPAV